MHVFQLAFYDTLMTEAIILQANAQLAALLCVISGFYNVLKQRTV
jgi:hypothetical protein